MNIRIETYNDGDYIVINLDGKVNKGKIRIETGTPQDIEKLELFGEVSLNFFGF
jgi:hypothetical protein